ncbi:MAG: HypC/HybG/HupF family hydrogenase formation chaperone [Anaerolineales bacterium]|nr:HypC/HybG/HupF family hydrogenase formation chaperone [Anaerolineales bacterium]
MCLGIPGKITDIYQQGSLAMGKVDFGGVLKNVCLEYVPEAKVGDYCLIHVGFAISLMGEEEATETLQLLREIAAFGEESADEILNLDPQSSQ